MDKYCMKNTHTNTYQLKKDETREIVLEKPGNYVVELLGSGAQVKIQGAFLAQKAEQKEITVTIYHKAPHTRADTVIKGVGKDSSHLKIIGRIIIEKDCGDSQSFLTERVLLLSDTAHAETVPDLEIKTDDVMCSHAASVTYLSEEQLFYLQARGITRTEAEAMLVEGFLEI